MTRDQVELVCRREGLTSPQTAAVLEAADAYATAQARLAIGALGAGAVTIFMHLQVHKPQSGPACSPRSGWPCTTERGDVTCEACKQTDAWKAGT